MMIYTMKTVTINKTKVKIFEEKEDLVEKLKMSDDNVKLVMTYQRTFPELMQRNNDDFVIDGETLCKELGVKDNYNNWLLRKTKGKEGKLIKDNYKENIDYTCLVEKSKTQTKLGRKGASVKTKILLTTKCAKKIAMRQNNDMGDLVCDYFMIMEDTLKDYENWETNRGLSKDGWNEMKPQIKLWCERNGYDSTLDVFYMREANMINKALTGFTASELNSYIGSKDNITRNHLSAELNKAIESLESTNTNLLISDSDFDFRKGVIEKVCKNKYSELHIVNKIKQAS